MNFREAMFEMFAGKKISHERLKYKYVFWDFEQNIVVSDSYVTGFEIPVSHGWEIVDQ